MKNILLVEPVKHDYIPIALTKISTFHKQKGNNVDLVYGIPYFLDKTYDVIYITSLFTWEYKIVRRAIENFIHLYPDADIYAGGICVSLLQEKFKDLEEKHKNFHTFFGLCENFDNYKIDYSLFKNIDYSVVYTTRGCVNRCKYCMVWKLEKFEIIDDWYKDINIKKDRIVLWDNNFLATGIKHIKQVVGILKTYNKSVDFNQGLDCRIWNDEIGTVFEGLKIHPLRFAYDNKTQDNYITLAIENAFKHNLKDIALYMLYNFHDTPEEIYLRLNKLTQIKECRRVMIFLMKYQPLDTEIKGEFIGENWNKTKLINLRNILSNDFSNGILRFNHHEHFKETFGNSVTDFVNNLNKEIKYNKFNVKFKTDSFNLKVNQKGNQETRKQTILNFD